MGTSDSARIATRRFRVFGSVAVLVILTAMVLAVVFDQAQWVAVAAAAGGILAGATYIAYRQRRGPLDWDQEFEKRTDSKFHHL